MKPGAPFLQSTRLLDQLSEWILGTHYTLKSLNFNFIRFLFIQFVTGLPGCAQASSRPVAHPQHLRNIGFELLDTQPADALLLHQASTQARD